jgi:predicted nucleic acid-binding protein
MKRVILDTNVISETARPRPSGSVAAWFAAQTDEHLFLTATVLGELAFGAAKLPHGRRQAALEAWLQELLRVQFSERVLPYGAEAALIYGPLVAAARSRGREPKVSDAQIAAVAQLHGMAVATRNVTDFEHLGVAVVNPWELG